MKTSVPAVPVYRLSILLPCYNNVCVGLVRTLSAQAAAVEGLAYEIIVADDGSTNEESKRQNRAINGVPHARLIELPQNIGRAAVRNLLVRESRMEHVLLMDSDNPPATPHFIATYLSHADGSVVYGGLRIGGNRKNLSHNLRYKYEVHAAPRHTVKQRTRHPYRSFSAANFMAPRAVMLANPFNEHLTTYGYEDVLLGHTFEAAGISITHIDNPVLFTPLEPNKVFVGKIDESILTLLHFEAELTGHVRLLSVCHVLERRHLAPLFRALYLPLRTIVRKALLSGLGGVKCLTLYKLGECLHQLNKYRINKSSH